MRASEIEIEGNHYVLCMSAASWKNLDTAPEDRFYRVQVLSAESGLATVVYLDKETGKPLEEGSDEVNTGWIRDEWHHFLTLRGERRRKEEARAADVQARRRALEHRVVRALGARQSPTPVRHMMASMNSEGDVTVSAETLAVWLELANQAGAQALRSRMVS